jgi:hypothetical protein
MNFDRRPMRYIQREPDSLYYSVRPNVLMVIQIASPQQQIRN